MPSISKEDYGKVSFFNTFFGTQLKLGPLLRTQDTTKFHSSYRTAENIGTIQRAVVFDGGDGYKIAPQVLIESPENGTTAIAEAYFKNPVAPDVQVGQGDNTVTPITLLKEIDDLSHITVSLNGIIQEPVIDYTVSGTTITFDEVVGTDENIMIYYLNYNDEYNVQSGQGDNTVTPITLTQTVNNPEDIIVSINGLTQIPITDYTVSGTTITFDEVVGTDENIVIQYLGDSLTAFQQGQGDDTTTPIVLSQEVNGNIFSSESKKEHVIITINGVRQIPNIDYTIDGTVLTFDEAVSPAETILVYYLDGIMRSSSEEFDYVAGVVITDPGSGYDYDELPVLTIAPSETGEIAIGTIVLLRGPYYNPISYRANERNSDFLIFRGNKSKRCVDPIITQYKLIPDVDNVGDFYETTPPITDRLQGI